MKVKFVPQNIEVEVSPGETILQVAQREDIFIKSVCNGVPSCAECRVHVIEGDHNVLQPSQKELQLIGTAHFVDQRRLSCQLRCFGDITVDLTEQVEKHQNEDFKRRKKLGVTKDSDQSQAKAGNLLDQDEELVKEVDSEVGDRVVTADPQPSHKEKSDKPRRPNRDQGKRNAQKAGGEGRSKNQKSGSRNNRNKNKGQQKRRPQNKNRNKSSKD